MKKYIAMLLMAVAVFGTISCSDNNDNEPVAMEHDDSEDAEERDEAIKSFIIEDLCIVNESETGEVTYEPRRGMAIDPTTPTVYYMPVNSDEEPLNTYNSIVSILYADEENPQTPEKQVEILDAKLSFSDGGSNGEKGRINVSIPELKNILTAIVFVSREKWPYNDNATPFNHLSVWKHKQSGWVFFCVRPSSGCRGIMLTFDGGWSTHLIDEKLHYLDDVPFTLYYNTAPKEAFECLVTSLNDKPDRFVKIKEALKQHGYNQNTSSYKNIENIRNVKESNLLLLIFRAVYYDLSFKTKKKLCKGYYCWRTHIYRAAIYREKGRYKIKDVDSYFSHNNRPVKFGASWAFYFDSNMNTSDFEPILK